MPTRHLPEKPSLAHFKHQAEDLLRAHRAHDLQALQRLREFHPRLRGASDAVIAATGLKYSDALLAIAREYGFPSWPRLKNFVEREDPRVLDLPAHERIADPQFKRAVELMDAGAAAELSAHLKKYPDVVHRRVELYGGNYFQTPALIEFVAENPNRHGTLPPNIAQIARIVLDAGAAADREAVTSALDLAASSRVARECGVQRDLIAVLCEYGGDATSALLSPVLYGEFEAVEILLAHGARMTLPAAAALGRSNDVRNLLPQAGGEERRLALALAAQHAREAAVRLILGAGTDPNGFIPVQGHAHATPLHQAALAGSEQIVRLLVEHGARADVRDILYGGTPADWARYAHHDGVAALLE